jgi:2-polyprenyl-3-methyl-5-hydroxy-6-metoxy-1,4-benzoquinol methylase
LFHIDSLLPGRWKFKWRYWRRQTPWDTQVTPPEVMEFISRNPPGKALDLGCGTGTNAITLSRHGWQSTGVDFVPEAIGAARRKAAEAGVNIDFHVADVTDLHMLSGAYDFVLDIGCLFTLPEKSRGKYVGELARLLRPNGWFMLYAWLPRPWKDGHAGISPESVETLLRADFVGVRSVIGEEGGHPSAWYWFRRR